jgi:hypothetical protein
MFLQSLFWHIYAWQAMLQAAEMIDRGSGRVSCPSLSDWTGFRRDFNLVNMKRETKKIMQGGAQ